MFDLMDVLQRENVGGVFLLEIVFCLLFHGFSIDKCHCCLKGCLKTVHDVTS